MLVWWVALALASPPGEVRGVAEVIDGDSLRVGEVEVRLQGVDAPEHDQPCWNGAGERYPCGARVAQALARWLRGHEVTCLGDEVDRYGRLVARCFAGSHDVGRVLVRAGGAVAYTRYSDVYAPDEAYARGRLAGIWGGVVDPPEAWRHLPEGGGPERVSEVERALRADPSGAAVPPIR